MLSVSQPGFYKYLANKGRPWKYQGLADVMKEICREDECNDTYGRIRMYQALLLKRDLHSEAPLEKCVTDITEIKAADGKLYLSAIFDCFDLGVLGLAIETNMKADLCVHTLENALTAYPSLEGSIIHSDRGAQYTSELYRQAISRNGIR